MERAAIAIIFNDKNEVLILERMEPQRDWSGYWGFPGGALTWGEEPWDAAIRETKEETGLDICEFDLKFLHNDYEEDWYVITYWTNKYMGEIYTEENHVVKWAPLEDLKKSKKWPRYNTEIFDKYIKISK